jgi:2-polyprenyl-3-methyl-5-hydroxy-6-metoxy-1,4-benzoquinol methylase
VPSNGRFIQRIIWNGEVRLAEFQGGGKLNYLFMYDFHSDRFEYFKTQTLNTEKYVIPFIELFIGDIRSRKKVLEVGCAEGGVLKAFVDRGCLGTGVELDNLRVGQARTYLKDNIENGSINILEGDIFDTSFEPEFTGKFDLIILKDVIEHIHDKDGLLKRLKTYLAPFGLMFLGFPPWRMPFGGHQQICRNKILSRLPWIHLLPAPIYKTVLKRFGEDTEYLIDIKKTGISIGGFEKMSRRTGFKIVGEQAYLINPIYEFKFGVRPVEQGELVNMIPYFRDFFTTCVYYLIASI